MLVRWRSVNVVERDHELFGFPTTEANELLAPVDQKVMPVILTTPLTPLRSMPVWAERPCHRRA